MAKADGLPHMTDKDKLFAAILADPEDDDVRLVYSDYLEEHGSDLDMAHAEYIRLSIYLHRSIELHRAGVGRVASPEWKEKQERANALFDQHRRDWFPELFGRKNILRGARGWLEMARGFPYKLDGQHQRIVQIGARLTQLAPFTALQLLDGTTDNLKPFMAAPWVKGLRQVGLGGVYGSTEPNWDGLAEGKHFTELRGLAITFGWMGRDGAARIAAANPFPKLEQFYFGTYSSDDAPAALFGGTAFTGLRSLSLSGGGCLLADSPMPGLEAICEAHALRSLKAFNLGCRPTPDQTTILTSSLFWPELEELDLVHNNLGNDDLARMLNEPSKLRRLELADNKITGKGARQLAEHTAFANIQALDLSGNKIGNRGLAALVKSPHALNLRRLRVSTCGFGLTGVTALAESANLENLRGLSMHSNDLDLKGARLLAASPHLANLEWLYVGGGLTVTACKALKDRFGERVSL